MDDTRASRRRRAAAKSARVPLALAVICAAAAVWVFATPGQQPQAVETPPLVAASPGPMAALPLVPSATPSPVPTATPTPTVAPEPEPWEFSAVRLSIPSIDVEGEVTEYTLQDFENNRMDALNGAGEWVNNGGVNPPTPSTISWDSRAYRQHDVKAIPSAQATQCFQFFGHAYLNGGAIFDRVADLPPGAEVVVTTATERLVYEVQGREDIFKGDAIDKLAIDPSKDEPLCGKLITCFAEGPRVNGQTVQASVITLRLVEFNKR